MPDRSQAIAGHGEDPTPKLVEGAQQLKDAGAAFYVAACNGTHAFLPRVREQVDLEYISMIDVTAEHLSALPYVKAAGLLATDATLTAGLYQRSLAEYGVEPIVPEPADQHTVMEAIYAVKAGNLGSELRASLVRVAQSLVEQGADVIVAACTEIPLALTAAESPRPLVDPAVLLANRVVTRANSR